MKPLTDPRTSTFHIEAALEAVCAALHTLEAAVARHGGKDSLIGLAMGSLHKAVDELRREQAEEPYPLALGFVVETGRPSSPSGDPAA